VLATFGEELGLDRKQALRIATGFAAGTARTGSICGAVTGAFMVIGLKHGRDELSEREKQENTYRLVKEFIRKFKEANASIMCTELLGIDISTPEGLERARDKGLFRALCPKLVQSAGEILGEIL